MIHNCFANTARGLEQLLLDEIVALGGKDVELARAGVKFCAESTTIMRINLQSRIASRVLLQIAHGNYLREDDIYDLAYAVHWHEWFDASCSIKSATNSIGSPLKSLEFVTLKVKDAVCDKFVDHGGTRPDVNKASPDVRIYTFLTHDTATLYIDTSGESLFKRGYRKNKLDAPLKENLAFALLKLANWRPEVPLYDPMCGSGTIVLEALSHGMNIAPGLRRNFAFENFKHFESDKWSGLQQAAHAQIRVNPKLHIFASDIDARAIKIAQENLEQLRLPAIDKCVKFSTANFLDKNAPTPQGILVTNPPYGIRLEEGEELAQLYPQWASHLKQNYANWNCYFLTADLRMPKLMRLKPSRKIPLYNGDLECRFYEFKMVAGSNRPA